MGGCASKPKDLDMCQQAPVPAEIPEENVPQAESTNEAEAKKEEPLLDISVAAEEAPKAEEATPEPIPAPTESTIIQEDSAKPTEEEEEVKAEVATEEKKEVVADEVSQDLSAAPNA